MASPSVPNTFANGATSDAPSLNDNFTAVINSLTDASKDLSISALTCAGNVIIQGNTTIGSASNDDLTVSASLASTIPIKTTGTYNFGSATLGLLNVYMGNGSNSNTVALKAGTTSSSYTFTYPITGGTSRYTMETNGSGTMSFVPVAKGPQARQNYSLAFAVGSNIGTVTLNGADGNAISSTNIVDLMFRNATATTGTPSLVSVSAGSLTVTIDSGATMGFVSGVAHWIYVYAMNNAGTVELAVSGTPFATHLVQTTTVLDTSADLDSVLYSDTARTSLAIRYLGRILSTQATAGTWASTATRIELANGDTVVQKSQVRLRSTNGHGNTTGTKIRIYATIVENVGPAITYATNAGAGDTFTINEEGIYSINYSDGFLLAGQSGITINSTELTTSILAVASADRYIISWTSTADGFSMISWCGWLKIADVVRVHTTGQTDSSEPSRGHFNICKIGPY